MSVARPALSLFQPWASLIASGTKTLETRSWAPHRGLIGNRLWIASTGSMPKEAKDALRHTTPGFQQLFDAIRAAGFSISWDGRKLLHSMPLGKMLCSVRLAGAYEMLDAATATGLPERCLLVAPKRLVLIRPEGDLDVTDQYPYGHFAPARWAWHLTDVEPIIAVPVRGRQGIWNWRPTEAPEILHPSA